MQVDRFVEENTTEYKANGGRIGFAGGSDRKSTRLNSSHVRTSRMPSSA